MSAKKLLVNYTARRLAGANEWHLSLGGKYVYVSGEVEIVGVWLSDAFYDSVRRVVSLRHPGFTFTGVKFISEAEVTDRLTHKLCRLMSSHGEVTFDASNGVVTAVEEYDTDEPGCLQVIYLVDVKRLRELLPDFEEHGEVDILNAGFWYVTERGSTAYEPPQKEHSEWAAGRRDEPC